MKKNRNYWPDATIVILSFNTKEITITCIQKALTAARYSSKELNNTVKVTLVDNNSSDGTVEAVRKKFGNVTVIANRKNFGVSKGYNLGMSKSDTPYILIINSDLYLEENVIVRALRYMRKNTTCDALMCKLFNRTGKFEPYGGYLPTPLRTALWLLGFESVPVVNRFIKRIYGYNMEYYNTSHPMEWAPTCFLFLKREVFESTKGHDENIFIYMDDVEWCKRIKDNGFNLWYTPDFSSQHLCGASTINKVPTRFLMENQVGGIKYYQEKHHPKTAFFIYVLLYVGFTMRSIAFTLFGQKEKAKLYLKVLPARL